MLPRPPRPYPRSVAHSNRALAFAAPPLILLIGAAALESLRLPAMLLLLFGVVASLLIERRSALVYGACLLVAVNLAWDSVTVPASLPGSGCADLLAPFAVHRAIGAALVLSCVVLVVRLMGAVPGDIGLRWTSRGVTLLSFAAIPALGAAAALLGPPLAEPFFGPVPSPTADLRAMAPALLFAIANASMEEAVYRGALLRWLKPTLGLASALAVQAFVFGLAHGVGTDFVGSPLPVMAATAAAGLGFGYLALRTGSLVLPIAIHVAFDISVYYGKACS